MLQDVEFSRIRIGWRCRVWFWVLTVRQSTEELHSSDGYSRWWVVAFWRAWRKGVRHHGVLRARPGEREALGWG